jgi:hypothetical protein
MVKNCVSARVRKLYGSLNVYKGSLVGENKLASFTALHFTSTHPTIYAGAPGHLSNTLSLPVSVKFNTA